MPPNVSLAEIGMDSMMAVEIKQTLERDFDITMTALDIRNLNFAKLEEIASQEKNVCNTDKIDTSNLEGLEMMVRKTTDSDFVPDILIELVTKKKVDRGNIF